MLPAIQFVYMRFVFFFFLMCASNIACSQNSILFTGLKVLDGFTENPLDSAKVSVVDRATMSVLIDSMIPSWGENRINGVVKKSFNGFYASVPSRAAYIFRFAFDGYEPEDFVVEIKDKRILKYAFERPYYVWHKSLNLQEVTVEASKILMVLKGDTIEYNAANFRMADGSMLDDLIRALPNVKIDDNGVITMNGKYIQSLLINGRDFFNGDPKIALANLPAYTVNKVKVYHKSQGRGKRDEELIMEERDQNPLVMDVSLKREYQQSWISNCEIGAGTCFAQNLAERWLGRMFALRYTNHSSIAIYAQTNNLGDTSLPSGKGEWKRTDNQVGERKAYIGGIDFGLDPKSIDFHVKTSLQVERQDIDLLSETSKEKYHLNTNTFHQEEIQNATSITNIKWNAKLNGNIGKNTYLLFSPKVYYERDENSKEEKENTFEDGDSLYIRVQDSSSREVRWGGSAHAYAVTSLGHNFLNCTGIFSYGKKEHHDKGTDDIRYTNRLQDDFCEQRDVCLSKHDYQYSLEVMFEMLQKKISNSLTRTNSWFSYNFTQSFHSGSQDLYRTKEGWLTPSTELLFALDLQNSYNTTRMEHVHTLEYSTGFLWNRFSFRIQGRAEMHSRTAEDYRNKAVKKVSRDNLIFSPEASVAYNSPSRSLKLKGAILSHLPNIIDLLDISDNSIPLRIFKGNPDLNVCREYTGNASYEWKQKHSVRIFRLNVAYNLWKNNIGTSSHFDTQTGITTYCPMNINGNWKLSSDVNYGQFIDNANHWHINTSMALGRARSVDFANNSEETDLYTQTVYSTSLQTEDRITYRKGTFQVSTLVNVDYKRFSTNWAECGHFSYCDFKYGINCSCPIFYDIEFSTDIMAYNRRGYVDSSLNTTCWVWNIALSRHLDSKKRWILKFIGFDVLHQLSNVHHTINAQGRTEIRQNTTTSYGMARLTYYLDVKPRKANQ